MGDIDKVDIGIVPKCKVEVKNHRMGVYSEKLQRPVIPAEFKRFPPLMSIIRKKAQIKFLLSKTIVLGIGIELK